MTVIAILLIVAGVLFLGLIRADRISISATGLGWGMIIAGAVTLIFPS